jgi:hypothetical protein
LVRKPRPQSCSGRKSSSVDIAFCRCSTVTGSPPTDLMWNSAPVPERRETWDTCSLRS